MSIEETEGSVRQYLDALLNGGDLAAFFAEEVVWTTMETGVQIRGRHTAEYAGVPATGAEVRLPYPMFNDISGGKIVALRAYFPITALLNQLQEAASAHA
jgi:hypothetical protein